MYWEPVERLVRSFRPGCKFSGLQPHSTTMESAYQVGDTGTLSLTVMLLLSPGKECLSLVKASKKRKRELTHEEIFDEVQCD